MRKVFVFANQKGGVGKTTGACALAHRLAMLGHVVVLIDVDPQGNAASHLGLEPTPAISSWLMGAVAESVAREARPNLWLIPNGPKANGGPDLTAYLYSVSHRETFLARRLDEITGADYIILDTGPSRGILQDNAHYAAHEVICPTELDHLALIGVNQELEIINEVRKFGHALTLTAIQPTMWDPITRESQYNLGLLVEQFQDLVVRAVPRATCVRESAGHGKTVWEYLHAGHPVLDAYEALIGRVK